MTISIEGITLSGGMLIGPYTLPAPRGSLVFDGSNYLTVPDNTAFSQDAGAWTVECFVYPTDSGQRYVYMQNTNGFLGIVYDGSSDSFSVDQKGVGFIINSATIYPEFNWYHVAMVYNGSGTVTLYVNGLNQGPNVVSGLPASSTVTNIGCYVAGNDAYKGRISNMRVTKGVAVYTGTSVSVPSFTVPTAPLTTTQSSGANISAITGTQCQLLLNTATPPDYFADASTNGFIVTNVNGVTTSITSPF
jgi:hypothetical protein